MDRVLIGAALQRRGINGVSIDCNFCINGLEDANHILASCPFATEVWNRLIIWCGISLNYPNFQSIEEIVRFVAMWGRCPKKRLILEAIFYGTLWSLWKIRNDRIFKNVPCNPTKAMENIKSIVFSWLKHRGKLRIGQYLRCLGLCPFFFFVRLFFTSMYFATLLV